MEIDLGSHIPLMGCICKLTEFGVELAKEYEELLKIGSYDRTKREYGFCHMGGRYEMSLMFINEPPFIQNGVKFYCLKEIGVGVMGDWHWYSLNQLMICIEK